MAIGKIVKIGTTAYKAAKKAKAAKAAKAAKPRVGPPMGVVKATKDLARVQSAGDIPRFQRSIRNARTRRNVLTDAAAMAGVAGIVGGAIYGGGKKKPTLGPKTKKNTPISAPAAGKKLIDTANKLYPKSKPVKKPVKKAVKKPVKKTARPMNNTSIVRNRRTPTTGPKVQVEVGSTVIRNRDGSIKKIKAPSAKGRAIVDAQQKAKKKSKYSRMTTAQINRLGGMERRKYKKWKESQKARGK